MNRFLQLLLCVGIFAASFNVVVIAQEREPIKPIDRRIPPPGIDLAPEVEASLKDGLAKQQHRLDSLGKKPLAADVAALLKAVRYAIELEEFYKPADATKAEALLTEAASRLDALESEQSPWAEQRGSVVRGFISAVDDSPQPYGMQIPADLDLSRPQPLIVWLHGRGDKTTDMHFLAGQMTSRGQVAPPWALVLHAFGRQCIGYKSAGETDVLEAVEHAKSQYNIDEDRIVLMGFSMGGAGAWHLGAHYADHWVAVSPGAGFSETARYQRLSPENYPPKYEQVLWGVYDVPNYVRNLFNTKVVAYSGEVDKQIQAARVMEEAYRSEGRELTHLIGPGMGHKYHPEVLADIVDRMHAAAKKRREKLPREVHLQTRTLRYNRMHWVEALQLEKHWQDSRIDATLRDDNTVEVSTKNIARLRLSLQAKSVVIDGSEIDTFAEKAPILLRRHYTEWLIDNDVDDDSPFVKRPGLQGPIDDAFREPFLFVLPSGESKNARLTQWVEFESAHQIQRWRELFRGDMRVKVDANVTAEDIEKYHLVLWGDPSSNRLIREFVASQRQPLRWDKNQIALVFDENSYDSESHVPVMIYPNPANLSKYVVLNSGPTFREAHDRTNSLQNPKLPDWSVLNIESPPTAEAAGKVEAAGFFDEQWK